MAPSRARGRGPRGTIRRESGAPTMRYIDEQRPPVRPADHRRWTRGAPGDDARAHAAASAAAHDRVRAGRAGPARRAAPVDQAVRQRAMRGFGTTMRVDRWIIRPGLIAVGLTRLHHLRHAVVGLRHPLLRGRLRGRRATTRPSSASPSARRCACRPGSAPAILVLWIQVLFRATCYYFRGAYYKAFFLDPPACAVGEPSIHRALRDGEQASRSSS